MSVLFFRILLGVLFIVVETVFFVALHTYFSHPVDQMRNWFVRRRKRTVAILLPLLFATNIGMTIIFSGLVSAPPSISPPRSTGVTRSFFYAEPAAPRNGDSSVPTDVEEILGHRETANDQEPIRGFPADDTLN